MYIIHELNRSFPELNLQQVFEIQCDLCVTSVIFMGMKLYHSSDIRY